MPSWIKLTILLGLLLGLFTLHIYDKGQAVDSAKAEIIVQMQIDSNKFSQELLRKNEIDTRNKDEQIDKLYTDLRNANDRLRKRPSRSSSYVTKPPSSCTGRELYREDGQFLRGEAAAAETLRIERDYYYNEYEKARQKLEELKGKING